MDTHTTSIPKRGCVLRADEHYQLRKLVERHGADEVADAIGISLHGLERLLSQLGSYGCTLAATRAYLREQADRAAA